MPQPNILLITVEHWSARFLGCAGHQCIMTPTLDSLAANGVRFTNALSPTPTCIPARRELMTGTSAKTHGDRVFNQLLQMPNLPTLADIFSQSGYQTYAAGKLHVYPQRDRIGFDDVILNEEGRHHLGLKSDDYELYLAEHGYVGQEFTHGMCNNSYIMRPWHLPEHCHPTNWTVQQMCKIIKRRDPKRPSFWYMSFSAPHPPLSPLDCYLRMYDELPINEPFIRSWAENFESLPYVLKRRRKEYFGRGSELMNTPHGIRLARQAY
ncbi:MAG: sulfatase-like hydrolase/transferase, partial [Candidatus Pacebacteria bacterium]|nr:sulfatase-like hydrolase/transferase [Candidatus Paceibacterota bacterium]